MASKFLLDKPKSEPVQFNYRGLVFWLKPEPSLPEWNKIRAEQMTAAGLDPGDIGKMDDWEQTRWYGKSSADAFVEDIEPFEIDQGDGVVDVFDFSGPSDMECYETQGQELLGENTTLQNDVFTQVLKISKVRPDYEVRALGKSSQPADSGE